MIFNRTQSDKKHKTKGMLKKLSLILVCFMLFAVLSPATILAGDKDVIMAEGYTVNNIIPGSNLTQDELYDYKGYLVVKKEEVVINNETDYIKELQTVVPFLADAATASTFSEFQGAITGTEYDVIFNLQGGDLVSGGGTIDGVGNVVYVVYGVVYGTPVSDIVPEVEKDGYRLLGWSKSPGGAVIDLQETVITSNITLYAVWGTNRIDVIFNLQGGNLVSGGGTVDGVGNVVYGVYGVVYGTPVGDIAPEVVRSGFRFIGWSKEPGGTVIDPEETVITDNITFYGVWARTGGGRSNRTNISQPEIPPVEFAQEHEAYLVGFPDGTIRPHGTITRAEVATIFFRLLSDEFRTEIWSQSNSFSDITSNYWFNNAISTLANANLIEGFPDGTFRGSQAMTRAEFVTMVSSFLDRIDYAGEDFFNDIYGHWANEAINLAGQSNLVNGYENGNFGPNQSITRAEVAAIINRMLNRQLESVEDLLPGMVTWPDNMNRNAWFYLDIQEATNTHDFEMKADGVHERWTELRAPRNWTVLERPNSRPGDIL